MTPTEKDLANMALDTLPPSIMVPGDGVHYSPRTAAAVATQVRAELHRRQFVR